MRHDNSTYSLPRRGVLAGLGAIGVSSVGAGLGTSAFFSDTETFDANALVAGELDLKVDWQVTYTGPDGFVYVDAFPDNYLNDPADSDSLQYDAFGNPIQGSDDIQDPLWDREYFQRNPFVADPESAFRAQFADVPQDPQKPIIEIADVKPGDSGEVTFSLHLFDNPGFIWMNGSLLENRENSLTEPELDDPDEDNVAPVPEGATDDDGELADEIEVTIWYDQNGDNVLDVDETVIVRGSLAEVLEVLSTDNGIPLDGDRSTAFSELEPIGDGTGSLEGPTEVPGNPHCADIGLLPALKIEEVLPGEYETPFGTVTIEEHTTKDNGSEHTVVTWSSTFPVQGIIVKGGNSANVYQETDDQALGSTGGIVESPNGTGISHLSFCYDAVPSDGTSRECFPNSTTQYIAMAWSLPRDHANEIQSDSVAFDIGFYTEQCRHNDGSGMAPDADEIEAQV